MVKRIEAKLETEEDVHEGRIISREEVVKIIDDLMPGLDI